MEQDPGEKHQLDTTTQQNQEILQAIYNGVKQHQANLIPGPEQLTGQVYNNNNNNVYTLLRFLRFIYPIYISTYCLSNYLSISAYYPLLSLSKGS